MVTINNAVYADLVGQRDQMTLAAHELTDALKGFMRREEFKQGADVGNDAAYRKAQAAIAMATSP